MSVPSLPLPRSGSPAGVERGERTPRATTSGDWAWAWQAVSGIAVLGLVTLHMVANHFVAPDGLRDFALVVAYLSNPVIVVLEVAFLVFVSWHGLLGLRAVLFDFGFSVGVERWITRAMIVIWLATVGYGLWLTSVIVGQT